MNVQLLGANTALPGFFEVFMIDRTTEALAPAFEYAVTVLSQGYPIFNHILLHVDECYALLLFFMQSYHLRRLGDDRLLITPIACF
jgi:hypothetical protein